MKTTEFEQKHNVKLIRKDKSLLMRIIGFFSKKFMERFWTTYRIQFCKPVITYPKSNDLSKYEEIPNWAWPMLEHELFHVEQFRHWYGPVAMVLLATIFPLPILFSGRWFIESPAYLKVNILKYNQKIDDVVNLLWSSYGWVYPKCLMRKWFKKKVKEHKETK